MIKNFISKHIDFNIITNKIINRFNQAFNFNNINVNVNLWSYICCLQSSKNIATVNDVFDIRQKRYKIEEGVLKICIVLSVVLKM